MPKGRASSDRKEDVKRLIGSAKKWIGFISSVLVLLFGYLELKDYSLVPISDDAGATIILKITLVLYFASWIRGLLFDLNEQKEVYLHVPYKGKMPWHTYVVSGMIAVMFGVLCWTKTVEMFVFVLTSFWLIDHTAWFYLVHFFERPAYDESKKKSEKNKLWLKLEKLDTVFEYVAGRWKMKRFIVGLALLIAVIFITYMPIGTKLTHDLLGFSSHSFTVAVAVLIIIVGVELWVWYLRIRTKMSLRVYERLYERYELVKKSDDQHTPKSRD